MTEEIVKEIQVIEDAKLLFNDFQSSSNRVYDLATKVNSETLTTICKTLNQLIENIGGTVKSK